MTSSRDTLPGPIFVGGSGRSGTHAMCRLIGALPRYHPIRVEARFHVAHGGLCDLLLERTDVDTFVRRCREQWWKRGVHQSGLRRILKRPDFQAALEDFCEAYERDPWEAARDLVEALLGPSAAEAGKPSWVEASGGNLRSSETLLRLFPNARFINMFRDGRAVAAGIIRKVGMKDDPLEALGHWEKRVRIADAAIRKLPPGSVLTVSLDELTALDRERSFRRLVDFLGVDDEGSMRAYFEEHISGDRAHVGRWRERMAPADARRTDRRYRRLVRDLHRDGITWVPEPERRIGPVRVPAAGRS